MLAHAGVHPLVVPADENQVRLLRQLVCQRLGVESALRLQQDDARVGGGLAGFDGFEDGFGLQHQSRAAAVGLVVGLFVLALREVAQLQGANLHQSPLPRAPDDAITNARFNHLWEQRDDIDA
jgi:hypothetical protein